MMTQWQLYSEKFTNISTREQYLIIVTGLVAIVFILYSLFLDTPFQRINQLNKDITQTQQSNRDNKSSIAMLEQALREDPNVALKRELSQYQTKLGAIDQQLLQLTSDLIDPIQMRYALIKLLKLQQGVKLLSFEVLPAQPVTKSKNKASDNISAEKLPEANKLNAETSQLRLYRHGIKIKLQGQYFQLKKYLAQLEGLSWKFFWQEFDYQLKTYPVSELEVEIYSLSTAQEFIGV
jgi:MSHA biogenesis protein MshJ